MSLRVLCMEQTVLLWQHLDRIHIGKDSSKKQGGEKKINPPPPKKTPNK